MFGFGEGACMLPRELERISMPCGETELEQELLEPSLLFGSRTISPHLELPHSHRSLELAFTCDWFQSVQNTGRWKY